MSYGMKEVLESYKHAHKWLILLSQLLLLHLHHNIFGRFSVNYWGMFPSLMAGSSSVDVTRVMMIAVPLFLCVLLLTN